MAHVARGHEGLAPVLGGGGSAGCALARPQQIALRPRAAPARALPPGHMRKRGARWRMQPGGTRA